MNHETNRLDTFTEWPMTAPVDPIRIAKAGFYYTGQGLEVQCFSCGKKISEWNYGDQVMWRHRRMEPNCAFVVNPSLSGNVPLVLGRRCQTNDHNALAASRAALPPEEYHEAREFHNYRLSDQDEMYRSDALRLLSFVNWEDTTISREALVSAGFYHAGEGKLRCAWCGGELVTLMNFGALGGSPLQVHRAYFPQCAHAQGLEQARRRSIGFSPPSSPLLIPPPVSSPQLMADNNPQSVGAAHNSRLLSAGGTWRSLGVVGGGARHGEYASLAARLASYERWPTTAHQTPLALSEAGFYYTGIDDQVRCFYCDGGLGKWESGDAAWSEHAHWFPHCGYVLLVKGHEFVQSLANRQTNATTLAGDNDPSNPRRRYHGGNFPVTERQIEDCMDSEVGSEALRTGLDVARIRRAVTRRLRTTGQPFASSEALIDAVLNEQLNEESWSVTPQRSSLSRDVMEIMRQSLPQVDNTPSQRNRSSSPRRSPSPSPQPSVEPPAQTASEASEPDGNPNRDKEPLTLEEENRQLKEARLCKVCMDNEVNVVFLPCGHLVSCASCGAALSNCPLCRGAVKALVRAYLA